MNLKIKDIVELLQVSEKTVYRWIKKNKIPAYQINHQYRFNKPEINDWILKNKIPVSDKVLCLSVSQKPVDLIELIKSGGIFYDIEGNNVKEVITNAVNSIHLSDETTREIVLSSLVAREEMMSTAVGKGIAFPHPRNPVVTDLEKEGISICFLKKDVDYHAIDGILVYTLFIILSANPKRHLEILSKLSFLCQQQDFVEILKRHSEKEKILEYINEHLK